MEWNVRQIIDTLRLIEESDYDEVRLETGDFKLHVRKSGAPSQLGQSPVPSHAIAPAAAASRPAAHAPTPALPRPETDAGKPAEIPEGCVAIRAPMIGTFYRAAAPHLPPFVDTGSEVNADDTVCLVEVMKLFNTIKAGVPGKEELLPDWDALRSGAASRDM